MNYLWKISIYSTITLVLVSVLWITLLWKMFSSGVAGSYPHAETWTFNVKENALLEIIREVKNEHPELNRPDTDTSVFTKDENWYHMTFYYSDTNENVQTWVRSESDSSFTTLALIAVSKAIDYSKAKNGFKIERKEINHDFNYFENRAQIKKFKLKIVNLIEEKIEKKHY
jgi:hypothetical protein